MKEFKDEEKVVLKNGFEASDILIRKKAIYLYYN